jgi:hypothetical protein
MKGLLGLAAAAVVAVLPLQAEAGQAAACNRACLYGHLDKYLAALKAKDATKVAWAPNARTYENNVLLEAGDGMWGSLKAIGSYDLRFADPRTGNVAFFGTVTEGTTDSPFGVRLKIVNGKVAEADTTVSRPQDAGVPFVTAKLFDKPKMNEMLAPSQRRSRAEMIKIADGYFDTLQRNDGTLHTPFADDCNRTENGMQTTNNKAAAGQYPNMALGCAAAFRLGIYRYDDDLRDRRYPMVDEERGIVLANGFIDHSGRISDYFLSDGRKETSSYLRPHSFFLMEAFKIKDGKLEQIEAVFTTVPYRMPYPHAAQTAFKRSPVPPLDPRKK